MAKSIINKSMYNVPLSSMQSADKHIGKIHMPGKQFYKAQKDNIKW